MEVLGISRPYLKEYFQEHQSSAFFFISKTKTLLFSGMLVLERAKICWEGYLFKNNFTMELLGMCLPYVKRYFQEYQWSAFFFIAQIAEILSFIGMLGLENSRITVWAQLIFWKFFNHKLFFWRSNFHKKVFGAVNKRRISWYLVFV